MSFSRVMALPAFVEIGRGLFPRLLELLEDHGLHHERIVVTSGPTFTARLGEDLYHRLQRSALTARYLQIASSTLSEVERLRETLREIRATLAIAVGGGKVLDVTKYATYRENVLLVTVPTTPSNDGIASPVAVLEWEGLTHSMGTQMPTGVVLDLDILEQAPERNVRAGIGDVVANLLAVDDWRLAAEEGRDRYDAVAAMMAATGAEHLLLHDPAEPRRPAFLERLLHALVLSGIAMGLSGSSRPCSGAEHEISHALDRLFPGLALHGEQVALGTVFSAYLRNHPLALQIRDFLRRAGLPTRLKDLNLTEEQFLEAVAIAPETRPARFTYLEFAQPTPEEVHEILLRAEMV